MASNSRHEGRFSHIKRVMQISDSHCGPATLRMMFDHLGVRVLQREIVKAANVKSRLKEHGVTLADMVLAVRALAPDFKLWYKEEAKYRDIDKIVNGRGYPLGVEWQGIFEDVENGESDEDGHYSLVTGIDMEKRQLWLANPYHLYAGKDMKLGFSDFSNRWWDENMLEGEEGKHFVVEDYRMFFLLTRKEDEWPMEMGMQDANLWIANREED